MMRNFLFDLLETSLLLGSTPGMVEKLKFE